MISPTGLGIREFDGQGRGKYGAPRDGGKRIHDGLDFICIPGQEVVCPSNNLIAVRHSKPYREGPWNGIYLKHDHFTVQLFYVIPNPDIWNKEFMEEDVLGIAQDISEKYKGMTPHVHLRIDTIDPELFLIKSKLP